MSVRRELLFPPAVQALLDRRNLDVYAEAEPDGTMRICVAGRPEDATMALMDMLQSVSRVAPMRGALRLVVG